jgi:hypothetical protein
MDMYLYMYMWNDETNKQKIAYIAFKDTQASRRKHRSCYLEGEGPQQWYIKPIGLQKQILGL